MRACTADAGAGRTGLCAVFFGALMLAGCAHHMRPMANDHTIVISGRSTAQDDSAQASRRMIIVAAQITLKHGFRYFRISGSIGAGNGQTAPSIRPGTDVTIQVYREGEVDPGAPGVWDSLKVSKGDISSASHP